MHYFFLDESYPSEPGPWRIVMAVWGVDQNPFNHRSSHLTDLFKPPVLERIEALLESLDARALVANASVDPDILRSAEIDSTDDVPAMARTDNIWSESAIFLVGSLICDLFRARHAVGTVDIYHDPKNLKPKHRQAVEQTMRELIVEEAQRFCSERGFNLLTNLAIRRIQGVTKPRNDERPDKFQVGVWVSHKLCSQVDSIARAGTSRNPRIKYLDMTEVVRRTIQQWEGRSFYAG